MAVSRRSVLGALPLAVLGTGLVACTSPGEPADGPSTTAASLTLDPASWSYDPEGDVYYQLGVTYVSAPQAPDYQTLAIFVPGAYMSATDNGGGTYTASVNPSGVVGPLTAPAAPVVCPVNTPGYSAQSPLNEYSYDTIKAYMEAGLIYVHAGLRGKDSNTDSYSGGAPWGVTDLKAAVRYLRYNAALIPGGAARVYVFGHSGGGAQSAIMGASGDSDLFTPYLQAVGAASTGSDGTVLSDAVAGAMCWCPITSLDSANAAYEWNMGQFATTGTRAEGTWTRAYSQDLAAAYANHLNSLGLTDSSGQALTLEGSSEGTFLAGTYYDHLLGVIEDSLNEFLAVTTFPYTPSSEQMAGMGGGPSGDSGGAPSGRPPADAGTAAGGAPPSGQAPASGGTDSVGESTTYSTVEEYIASLNSDSEWVTYDAATNTAAIADLAGFVTSQKSATKDVGAFDGVDRGQTENVVFGRGSSGLHFSTMSRDVIAAGEPAYAALSGWNDDYGSSTYDTDLAITDSVGTTVPTRVDMYDPLSYLVAGSRYAGTSVVAPSWRIRTGITQGDTASTVEINLALALKQAQVGSVDFATVWGQGHTMAESTGSGEDNFIAWVSQQAAS
ncbi:subtype A tannase [Actinomyces oricola]|uniref:subtype A tannase n=1 Tax=Actinomyces oricola TaxID=206043 RepID=UPI000FFE7271|nr:subtype A tannase [Actinomyces oricola]